MEPIARPGSPMTAAVRAVVVLAFLLPSHAWSGEISAAVAVTSDYVYRGQSLTDGNPALQAAVDFEHGSGLFAGAWASTVNLENFGGRRDAELDWYLGYRFEAHETIELSITAIRYTYPGQTTYFNYDFTELLASATLFGRHSLEFGYSDEIYGWDADGYHGELRSDWPMHNAWVVSAGVGYNVLDDQGTSNYWYGDVGASARFNRVMVDLRWYVNEEPTGQLAALSVGSKLVVSLSVGF